MFSSWYEKRIRTYYNAAFRKRKGFFQIFLHFRHNDSGKDVDDDAASHTAEGQDDPNQADYGRIYLEVFSDSAAYAADNKVLIRSDKFFFLP